MLNNKPVVGHIGIEGPDDVVAVVPGIRHIVVELVAAGFRIADQIEPVASPPLAMMRRGEQPVDNLRVNVVSRCRECLFDLFRSRRQSDDIKRGPPQPCPQVRIPSRAQPLLFQPGEDEAVDRVAAPRFVTDGGRFDVGQRLERPVLGTGIDVER